MDSSVNNFNGQTVCRHRFGNKAFDPLYARVPGFAAFKAKVHSIDVFSLWDVFQGLGGVEQMAATVV